MAIVTLAEAKRQLRIPDTDDSADAELQSYVDAIGSAVEDYKNEIIEPREITEDVEAVGRRFRLWSTPVLDLVSVEAADGSRSWDPDRLRASRSGLVQVLAGPPLTGLVTVTYRAGYAEVPERYKRGALVVLQHNWETQRGLGAVGAGVVGAEEHYDPRGTYSIPRKALEWLGRPRPVVA